MPLGEIGWRVRSKLSEAADRVMYRRRRRVLPLSRICGGVSPASVMDGAVPGAHLESLDAAATGICDAWRERAVDAAERLMAGRLALFDLDDVSVGPNIDWNYEYKAGRATPTGFAPAIDYRDRAVTGDCKFVWEPSRHHHLVTLGRAYRLTGDLRFAEAALRQLDGWIEQCPFGSGMQWRSPLELGIRLINWVWTLELVRPSGLVTGDRAARILSVAYRHLWDISRKYSRFSSANNHLVGEAAGVFIGSSYFAGLRGAARRRAESRAILLREILNQTYADGGHREQAFGYHLFVLQFFLLAGLVARNSGDPLTAEFWARLEKMFEFAAGFIEAGGSPPMFGDCDDGYVLDLGGRLGGPRTLMGIGATLFDRNDFKTLAGERSEAVFWLFGDAARRRLDQVRPNGSSPILRSRGFRESGYYILQSGGVAKPDSISVTFDCGPLGFQSIAAHGHADALSFTLRVGGEDVLVDPGTYDYFSFDGWRDYFRSTAAHNTVVVDGADQSEMLGPFMWGRRANAKLLRWSPDEKGGVVCGEHDGYRRLPDPVTHRRTLELVSEGPELRIGDDIIADGAHEVRLHWHLAEHCRVTRVDGSRWLVDFGRGRLGIELDPRLSVSVVRGCESPILGWTSRGYHRKRPSPTVVARCRCDGAVSLQTRITLCESSLARWGDASPRADGVLCP